MQRLSGNENSGNIKDILMKIKLNNFQRLFRFIIISFTLFYSLGLFSLSLEEIEDEIYYKVFASRSFNKIHLVIKSYKRQSIQVKAVLFQSGKSVEKTGILLSGENKYFAFRHIKKGRCIIRLYYRKRFVSEDFLLLKELSFIMP